MALRRWRPEDAPELVRCLDGDPEIGRFIELIPQPYTEEAARSFVVDSDRRAAEGTSSHFAVVDAGSGALLGEIDVSWNDRRDVGEGILRAARRRDRLGRRVDFAMYSLLPGDLA